MLIPLGALAPVITKQDRHAIVGADPMYMANIDGTPFAPGGHRGSKASLIGVDGNAVKADNHLLQTDTGLNGPEIVPDNLYADLSKATGTTINELRRLISLQHIFEGDARHGTRYFERLESI